MRIRLILLRLKNISCQECAADLSVCSHVFGTKAAVNKIQPYNYTSHSESFCIDYVDRHLAAAHILPVAWETNLNEQMEHLASPLLIPQ